MKVEAAEITPATKLVKIKKMNKVNKIKKHWQLYLIILIPLVWVILFKYVPMYGIQIAFREFRVSKGFFGSEWVGLKYFHTFFSSPTNFKTIINTVIISIYGVIVGFPFAILLAISLNEAGNRFLKKTVQMVTYAPYFISTVVLVALLLQIMDSRDGIVSQFIVMLGGKPQNILGNAALFKSIYVWSGAWQTTGYNAVIYLAVLSGISMELYEAAEIDGASRLQKIWHIDIPGIMPTVVILLIMSMGNVMSVGFEKIYLMQNSLNLEASEVISTYVYRVGLIQNNYGFSTAINLFNSVVNMVLLSAVNLFARRYGETSLW